MRVLMSVTSWDAARVEAGLRQAGCLMTTASDGIALFESLDLLAHPVVIVETDLPDINWHVAVSQLRAEHPNLAIVALQTGGNVSIRLEAFNHGADEVIDPWMDGEEIRHRILAVATRRAGHAGPVLRQGSLRVDLRTHSVMWGPAQVDLSPSQYELLEYLALNAGHALSRDDILGQLYGVDDGPDPRVIDVFVCKLRMRLQAAGAPEGLIETVRGHGFRLVPDAPCDWPDFDGPMGAKILPFVRAEVVAEVLPEAA